MDLYACVSIHAGEENPRDVLWFDLFRSKAARDAHMNEKQPPGGSLKNVFSYPTLLPVENTFIKPQNGKMRKMQPGSLEEALVCELREQAKHSRNTYLGHAYRCLATCLENYARYGCVDAAQRTVGIAESLSMKHTSLPYRQAFREAREKLLDAARRYWLKQPQERTTTLAPAQLERVYYVSVISIKNPMPLMRIRLFQYSRDAQACLTEWLKQYGIPYEVWRSLRSVVADETLPYMQQDGLFIDMGEKTVCDFSASKAENASDFPAQNGFIYSGGVSDDGKSDQ